MYELPRLKRASHGNGEAYETERESSDLLGYKMAGRNCTPARTAVIGIILFIIGLIIGVLSGYFGKKVVEPKEESPVKVDGVLLEGISSKIISDADPKISKVLQDEIDSESIRNFLKDYASHPHLAGTPADKEQAEKLKELWLKQGLDRVNIVSYDVLLSYPKPDDPSYAQITIDGKPSFTTQLKEKELRPEDISDGDDVVPPFNAYSPPGDVDTDKMFYVNYGREEDFHFLVHNLSLDLNNSVVIARYGKIFRGDKVKAAAPHGVRAVLLYSDPFDYASPDDNSSYPHSWWLPDSGVQRGTVKNVDGDPLTFLYPALDSAYRDEIKNNPYLPQIPAHPISYGDAKELLKRLSGLEIPPNQGWEGAIKNVTYMIGGQFKNGLSRIKVHITTDYQTKKTYNVIGYIDGAVEPDRYVMVGNHRDAWVYGAVDPTSATAALLETSRALGKAVKSSWRPRRSIVFCSWGAEEHGLIGSVEFTEHFSKTLGQRAVAYIQADVLIEGTDFMRFKATPMLYPAAIRAAKKVPNPNSAEVDAGRTTVYDTWLHLYPASSNDPATQKPRPQFMAVGSGSDYSSFLNVLGIPCLEPRYTWDRSKWKISSYPMYHSVYETFYLVDHIMDPGFKYSKAVTQVWIEIIRDLSDSMILPLDVSSMASFISEEHQKLVKRYEDSMKAQNLTKDLEFFNEAVTVFKTAADSFQKEIPKVSKYNIYAVREVNDKLMNLHRSFLDPVGLPGRANYKNLLAAPSEFNSYGGTVFPTITDSMYRIDTRQDADKWKKVKKNMSIVTYALHSAAATLRKVTEFTKL